MMSTPAMSAHEVAASVALRALRDLAACSPRYAAEATALADKLAADGATLAGDPSGPGGDPGKHG